MSHYSNSRDANPVWGILFVAVICLLGAIALGSIFEKDETGWRKQANPPATASLQ